MYGTLFMTTMIKFVKLTGMIKHHFIVSLRSLLKYKTQNFICILGVAVGILCFTICLYCTRLVLTTNDCFPKGDRIAQLSMLGVERPVKFAGTCVSMVEELREIDNPHFSSIASIGYPREVTFNVHLNSSDILPYSLMSMEVDTSFNTIFTPALVAGSWETAQHNLNSIIMGESTARRIFGNPLDAINKTIVLTQRLPTSPKSTPQNGGIAYTIVAVMEDIPLNNSFAFLGNLDILRVNDTEGIIRYENRRQKTASTTYILLNEDSSAEDVTQWLKDNNYTFELYGDQYHAVANMPSESSGGIAISAITAIIGLLILATALLNFFNFLIALFYSKTREYTIRKVYGCDFRSLFMQLFTHTSVMLLLSSLIMLSIAELIADKLYLTIDSVGIKMYFNKWELIGQGVQYILAIFAVCCIICLLITRRVYRMSVYRGIKTKQKRQGMLGRNIMLWWQLFITWIFIGVILALIMQSNNNTDMMFPQLDKGEKEEILSVSMDYTFMDNVQKETMMEEFSRHSGVKDIMVTDVSLVEGISGYTGFSWEKGGYWFETGLLTVPQNFFSFMNVDIEQGVLPSTEKDVVVDRMFQELRKTDVLGRALFGTDTEYNICAVAPKYNYSIYDKGIGFVFTPRSKNEYIGHCYIKCHKGQTKQVRQWVEGIRKKMLPSSIDYKVSTLLKDIYSVQIIEFTFRKVIIFFALVCIIITLLGVYSSVSLDTDRKQKEMALRKINGANRMDIAWEFVRMYAVLLLSSAAVAFPLLYVIFHYWKQMYVRFFTYGPLFWIVLFLLLATMVGVTIYWKIADTVNINPARVIVRE